MPATVGVVHIRNLRRRCTKLTRSFELRFGNEASVYVGSTGASLIPRLCSQGTRPGNEATEGYATLSD